MGAAPCRSSKASLPNPAKVENKNITIGVFGLDDAGKTSTVKAIEGEPTENTAPTMGSVSTMVTNPLNGRNAPNEKNKKQQNIKIIDVSGERRYRQKSWPQFYDQIHGLIFVIDASDRKRLSENQATLEDLLRNDKLKDKPILLLANKQDQKGAISKEQDLKRQLDIEKLRSKHKIELCAAVPTSNKNKVDESIRKGFSWLIRTIEENYTELNARVSKSKNAPRTRFESDGNDSDEKYSKFKSASYHSNITSEKLPSINTNKNKPKVFSDDDDDYSRPGNEMNKKKKKVLGGANNIPTRQMKNSNENEPKAFRSTFESFPEETPWSLSSMLKPTKSDETLPRLYPKLSATNDTKRRGVSPLVHDTKSYTNGSRSKRDENSDDEDDYRHRQQPKSTNRFSSNSKQPTTSIYDDDNTRRNLTGSKKPYNHDDEDEEDNYLKKSTSRLNKNYDFDEDKTYPRSSSRSNLTSDYRGTLSKPGNYSKYDDDHHRPTTFTKKDTRSKFDSDDDEDYSPSKPITRSAYNNDYSTSKSKTHSKFEDDDYPKSSNGRSRFNDDDDDDYHPSSSSKTASRSKYDDDDDDDYHHHPSSSKNPSTYPRTRFENNDFLTTKAGSNSNNRFRKTTDYDS